MKLTTLLSNIVLEAFYEAIPVISFMYEGKLITLMATKHQTEKRKGYWSLETTVEEYEYNHTYNSKHYERTGAPNGLLGDIFIKNFPTIKNKMSKLSLVRPNNTIIFVKK